MVHSLGLNLKYLQIDDKTQENTLKVLENSSISQKDAKVSLAPVNSEDILDLNPNYEPCLILKPGLCISKDYEILPPKA